jgi:hypothetical protein
MTTGKTHGFSGHAFFGLSWLRQRQFPGMGLGVALRRAEHGESKHDNNSFRNASGPKKAPILRAFVIPEHVEADLVPFKHSSPPARTSAITRVKRDGSPCVRVVPS